MPQSPLWTAGGVVGRGTWYPWALFEGTGPRVQARLVDTSERDGLWTMAVRQDGAPCRAPRMAPTRAGGAAA